MLTNPNEDQIYPQQNVIPESPKLVEEEEMPLGSEDLYSINGLKGKMTGPTLL